jgi:hypothetical protein
MLLVVVMVHPLALGHFQLAYTEAVAVVALMTLLVQHHYLAVVVAQVLAVLLEASKMVVLVVMQYLLAQAKQVVQVVLVTAHSKVLFDHHRSYLRKNHGD